MLRSFLHREALLLKLAMALASALERLRVETDGDSVVQENDVKIAYRKGLRICHPDKGGSSEAFLELHEAFLAATSALRLFEPGSTWTLRGLRTVDLNGAGCAMCCLLRSGRLRVKLIDGRSIAVHPENLAAAAAHASAWASASAASAAHSSAWASAASAARASSWASATAAGTSAHAQASAASRPPTQSGRGEWLGSDDLGWSFLVKCRGCDREERFRTEDDARAAWHHIRGKPWWCPQCWPAPSPSSSPPSWKYRRPADEGGALQPHLLDFPGYARFSTSPGLVVADLDWQAIVEEVSRAKPVQGRPLAILALKYGASTRAGDDLSTRKLRGLQQLGAWTLDYAYTASLVARGRARATVYFQAVPNSAYAHIGEEVAAELSRSGLGCNDEAVGNVFEVAAGVAFSASDYDFVAAVVHAVSQLV